MFTGIVSDIGTVTGVERRGDLRITVATRYDMNGVALGASIACSGVCLTVVDKGADWFSADVSAESVACTARRAWVQGATLNLERAMRIGDELGGHIVTGHVDGVGEVVGIADEGDSHRVTIAAPAGLAPYIAAKGSITVDGVSLTVNSVEDQADQRAVVGLNIIPHSWSVTTLGRLARGDWVNLEIDVLARYLSRMQDVIKHRAVI